jgi:SAM-dependent methyltransferase
VHLEVLKFISQIKEKHPQRFVNANVLECGSQIINGTPRGMFQGGTYVGVDLGAGKGVDVISKAKDFVRPLSFDVVITTEMLEHDKDWMLSLETMYLNLKHGGLFIMTCATDRRREHGTKRTTPNASPFTPDYYGNISEEAFKIALDPDKFSEYKLQTVRGNEDLQFYGIKL